MTEDVTDQVDFTEQELLASHEISEPLILGGVRCHGGFDEAGSYVSPRTLNRVPAVRAWQAQHTDHFGTELLGLPIDTWPENYPNVAQARYLIEAGAPQPIISDLTRIGTVEGFGGLIRNSVLPDWQTTLVEDTRGTAIAHLGGGLYEAHARDEAGFEDEGGHKQMWFACRDIAFDSPISEDMTVQMLERMGIATPGTGGAVDQAALRAQALAHRVLSDDIDFGLESLLARMIRLLFIEISAFHAFAWAEDLLSDTDLVSGEGAAARLVSYIRSDETPHVEYLRTVLSEMRDRTVIGRSGRHHAGADVIGPIWDRALEQSLGVGREQGRELAWREVVHALDGRADGADVLDRFNQLGTVQRDADGSWRSAVAA
jgi:hypothetical protein